MAGVNGHETYDDIIERIKSMPMIPIVEKTAGTVPSQSIPDVDEDPIKIAEQLKEAARQLGDGKSYEPASYTPVNEGLEHGPEKNTDPVSEAGSGPELSHNIKAAVLANLVMPTEKTAASGEVRRAMAIGLPLAALVGGGVGYYGGRAVGKDEDKKNNQAYYEAGVYDAARHLASQITGVKAK